MNIAWDCKEYQKNFDFVYGYGESVLELLDAPKESFVVDLGCGNGALTKKIAQMGYRVMGIDDSKEMLSEAKKAYPDIAFKKDNACTFCLEQKADVIFSNSLVHWIEKDKQKELAQNIADNLTLNGTFIAEFGAKGCAETIHGTLEKVFAEYGLVYPRTFYFPTIGEYATILESAGLRVEYAIVFDRPTLQKTENGVADFIRMFIREPFYGVDKQLAQEMIQKTQERTRPKLYTKDGWMVDFVRIRVKARNFRCETVSTKVQKTHF